MQSLFLSPEFSITELTASINHLDNTYGRLESLKLFPNQLVSVRSIAIEEQNGVLSLLPTQSPGGEGTVGKRGKRKIRTFTIPHIPHDDVVLPEEFQGVRQFGSGSQLVALAKVIAKHLKSMKKSMILR